MNILASKTYIEDIETTCSFDIPWGNLDGKTILITGVTGLICSCIADVLLWKNRTGADINLVFSGRNSDMISKRFEPFKEGKDYVFAYFDAVSGTAPLVHQKIDYIIHGASNAHPAVYSEQPVETMLANLLGTDALLKMAVENNTDRFLYISSSEVCGRKEGNTPYSENDYGYVDILNPRACYPSSKRAAETLCAAYLAEYGVDYVTVRPGHIYGPTMTATDSRASAQFARNAVKGENIVMKSAGTQLRSYCHVTDCVSAILVALLNGRCGEVYNISNSDSICTIKDLAEAFSRAGGVSVIYTQSTRKELNSYNLMPNSSLTSDKLEALGWKGKVSLDDGVGRTVRSLKEIENLSKQLAE